MSRREFRDLASPERAREVLASLDLDPGAETVALEACRGRVTAERVDATLDVPGFDRSTMDGYAVRAEDTFGADADDPAVLDVVGAIHAGTAPDVTVDQGTAAEISTGAVLPRGADAVVMVEQTVERDGAVAVRTAVAPGDSVMVAGTDIAAGSRAIGPGTRLTSRDVGLLSALGVTELSVRGRPRVGIISTGDELVQPGAELDSDRGEIYDVNSHTLAAAVAEAGGQAVRYPHVGDDFDALEETLVTAAAECDLVLSSGSTSAGAVDVIYRVIEERGDLLLHGVAVKPGKPMLVGRIGASGPDDGGEATADSPGGAYVGLPGYPVSALVIFRTFVAPLVREAAGLPEPETGTVSGEMAVREQYSEGRLRFMPVGLVEDASGAVLVYPVDKGSGATTSLVEADGVVEMPPEVEYLDAGERVTVRLFSPDVRPPGLFGVGEDDPGLSRLLDSLDTPRYLPLGSREGRRRLRGGVPDVAVVAGPAGDVDGERLGGWSREWGLLVPAGNPDGLEGVADLVDRDLQFVNRDRNSGLRASLESVVETLATERDVESRALTGEISGFELTTKAHESPGRRVLDRTADVGLGLRATASKLDLGFVSLGHQRVDVYANPGRRGKASVQTLEELLEEAGDAFDGLDGFTTR